MEEGGGREEGGGGNGAGWDLALAMEHSCEKYTCILYMYKYICYLYLFYLKLSVM